MKFFAKFFSAKRRSPRVNITRRFELVGRVGQGSMSKVWRARDTKTGKYVALKVLDREKTARLEARFVGKAKPTEGEIAIQLQHPNIVKTTEHGFTTDNEQYLVMDFVDGVGLSYLVDMQNERMQNHRLVYMIQLGGAIEYFHSLNWIHRDICPRNVLITDHDRAVLIDFGLAVPNTEVFQAPGNRTGTAMYMAPELIKRQKTDQRIDVFSFSISCYEMFTRRQPWDASQTLDMVMQHINSPGVDIRKLVPRIDEQVAQTIMKGIERDPRDRWQTMGEMVQELKAAQARLAAAYRARKRKRD